jgi:hypothetical protein
MSLGVCRQILLVVLGRPALGAKLCVLEVGIGVRNVISAAQIAGRNIVLAGEAGEIIEPALNFLHARLQLWKSCGGRHG